jgi:hypothetical protein
VAYIKIMGYMRIQFSITQLQSVSPSTNISNMSRLSHAVTLLSLATIGVAQVPNIIPFTVTGSLDG